MYKVLVTSVIKTTSFNERTSHSLHIPISLLPSQPRDFNLYKLLQTAVSLSFKNPANTMPLFYANRDRTMTRVKLACYLERSKLSISIIEANWRFSYQSYHHRTSFGQKFSTSKILIVCVFKNKRDVLQKKSQPHAQISQRFLQLALLFLTRWPCTAGGCTWDRYSDGCHPSTSALNSEASVTGH